jgi:hypothetical protein
MPVSTARPISILDDDRLKPLACDQAMKLRTACLEMFEHKLHHNRRLTWEPHFDHGTIPVSEPRTTKPTAKEKIYRWLDDLVNQNEKLHIKSRSANVLLPWLIIKTAIGSIFEVCLSTLSLHYRLLTYDDRLRICILEFPTVCSIFTNSPIAIVSVFSYSDH